MIKYLKTFKPVDFSSTARLIATIVVLSIMFFVFLIVLKLTPVLSIAFAIYEVILIDQFVGIGREHTSFKYALLYLCFNISLILIYI